MSSRLAMLARISQVEINNAKLATEAKTDGRHDGLKADVKQAALDFQKWVETEFRIPNHDALRTVLFMARQQSMSLDAMKAKYIALS